MSYNGSTTRWETFNYLGYLGIISIDALLLVLSGLIYVTLRLCYHGNDSIARCVNDKFIKCAGLYGDVISLFAHTNFVTSHWTEAILLWDMISIMQCLI